MKKKIIAILTVGIFLFSTIALAGQRHRVKMKRHATVTKVHHMGKKKYRRAYHRQLPHHKPSANPLKDYFHAQCGKSCVDTKSLMREVKIASTTHKVSQNALLGVMAVESSFKKRATNGPNKGLMQINTRVHRKKLGRNPYAMKANIMVGAGILKACLKKKAGRLDGALACYKGAPNQKYIRKVKRHMTTIAALRTSSKRQRV